MNSPYYLNHPVTVQKGIRLTIEPGVKVYMNTTNSSIKVHGEIHAEGNASDPIIIGVNPNISRTCSQGYWGGIRSDSPHQGDRPLLLRNVTLEGTRAFNNCGGPSILDTYYFGRTNSVNVMDNLTIHTAGSVDFRSDDSYNSEWVVKNITIRDINNVRMEENRFNNQM